MNDGMRSLLAFSLIFALACSDDDPKPDAGMAPADAVSMDAPAPDADDAGVTDTPSGMDAEGMDAEGMDAEAMDATPMMPAQMEPGDHVQTAEARIQIGDTFAVVKQNAGMGMRSAAENSRAYTYIFAGGVEVAVWYANTNLDDDDAPPNDVDDSDRVLWIAVSGSFTGKTSRGIGLGSTRAEVEAAAPAGYGPPPRAVDITTPAPGTLAQYFTTGMFVAYDMNAVVRTVTICRAYRLEPSGTIDFGNGELDFAGGSVRGLVGFSPGSRPSEVISLLGEPDGRGNVVIANQTLGMMSYGFIGIEVFHSITPGLERVFFSSVHAPYYGTIAGSMAGIHNTRAEVEAALGLGTGVESMSGQLVCYEGGGEPDVAVSYDAMTGEATTITVPLVRSMMSMSCP
jgi:hypothetical protein